MGTAGITVSGSATGGGFSAGGTWVYQPLPTQRRFHTDFRTRYKGFSGPIGSGKSKALAYEAIFAAHLNPGLMGLVGAPTFPMLRDATQRTFFEILEEERIGFVWRKSENKVKLTRSQSEILFRSLNDYDRLRGPNLAWFGVDELTYCKPDAWPILEGRLRDKRAGRALGFAAWTPKGYDWVHERFISGVRTKDGKLKFPNHRAYLGTPKENFHVGNEFYDALASTYDDRFYRQEVLGEYLNASSEQVYHAFDGAENVRRLPYLPAYGIGWTLDFNVNPMSSLICQKAGGTLRVLEEIVLHNANTLSACERFLECSEKYAKPLPTRDPSVYPGEYPENYGKLFVTVYGDASADSRKSSASRTDWYIVKQFFSRHSDRFDVHYRIPSANPIVKDRVNSVNAMLCNYLRQRRLLVDPSCTELVADLKKVVWKTDAHRNLTSEIDDADKDRTHTSSALGYLIWQEFPLKGRSGERREYVI